MDNTKHASILLQSGTYMLGMTLRDKDGNIKEHREPQWTADPDGQCIITVFYDDEKNEPIGKADLFPKWDTERISDKIREMLGLKRTCPSLVELYKMAVKEGYGNPCAECSISYDCSTCPIQEYKDSLESED